jgi:hypothetical protein
VCACHSVVVTAVEVVVAIVIVVTVGSNKDTICLHATAQAAGKPLKMEKEIVILEFACTHVTSLQHCI